MSREPTLHAGAKMGCDQVSNGKLAEKYLLGQLSEAEQEAYERHYFECAHCFDELQTHRALHSELKQAAAAIRAEPLPRRVVWHWAFAPVTAMAILIAGLGIWQLRHMHLGAPTAQVARNPQQTPTRIGDGNQRNSKQSAGTTDNSKARSLVALAAVQPPPYRAVTLRGNEDEAAQKFELAMQRYLKKDYAGAVRGLRATLKLDPEAADARFYLGVSYLLTGQADSAIEALRRAVNAGDSPYLESSHFYLAKAFIGKNNLARAAEEFGETAALHGSHEAEARRIMEQLQVLRRAEP